MLVVGTWRVTVFLMSSPVAEGRVALHALVDHFGEPAEYRLGQHLALQAALSVMDHWRLHAGARGGEATERLCVSAQGEKLLGA